MNQYDITDQHANENFKLTIEVEDGIPEGSLVKFEIRSAPRSEIIYFQGDSEDDEITIEGNLIKINIPVSKVNVWVFDKAWYDVVLILGEEWDNLAFGKINLTGWVTEYE